MLKAFNHNQIKREYQETSAYLNQIAEHHGINYNTLKSYARRHNWQKHSRITQHLESIYYPDRYTNIPYRIIVFSLLVSIFELDQTTAYRFTYCTSKEIARVNAYRLMKRQDTKYLIYYFNLVKDVHGLANFRLHIKPCYFEPYLDARDAADQTEPVVISLPHMLEKYREAPKEPQPLGLHFYGLKHRNL